MTGTKDMESGETYTHPAQVLADQRLTREEKVRILRDWHYDAIRMQEAASENMAGGDRDRLQAVSNALLELGETPSEPKKEDIGALSSLRNRLGRNFSRLFGAGGA